MNDEQLAELEWLRYLAKSMYHCLGPADGEIVMSINRSYEKGGKIPTGLYAWPKEEDNG